MPDTSRRSDDPGAAPDFAAALALHLKIGLLSFGGPAGQIALMQSEFVDRRGWIRSEQFDRGLAFSMLLPGPEAQQLATWIGWRLHGTAGGLVAGLAFVLPGMALMILLAWVAATQGDVPWVAAIFGAIQPVVIAIVLGAMIKLGQRALAGPLHAALAVAAFLALWALGAPFPLIVLLAALAGLLIGGSTAPAEGVPAGALDGLAKRVVRVSAVSAVIMGAVLATTLALTGPGPSLEIAELFTTAAFVTFGGAYAVLPFVAERAVESYGWLGPVEMLNGLAIAEATPGPLILVNTYAGFFAGWTVTGDATAGAGAAMLATFYTFAPSFMLILAFAPAVEVLHAVPWASRALAGVSAAVVGVIANLAVYLGAAALFPSGDMVPDWTRVAIFALALLAVFWARLPVLLLVALGAATGLALHLAGVW